MRKHITDRVAQQLSEKVQAIGHDKAYDWFIAETRRLNLTDAEQFRVVLLAGGIRETMVQQMPKVDVQFGDGTVADIKTVESVTSSLAQKMQKVLYQRQAAKSKPTKRGQANHNRSATRANHATPSAKCLKDARMFCGVAPYNEPGNYIMGDGYFAADCRKKYGDKLWERACQMVCEEKK